MKHMALHELGHQFDFYFHKCPKEIEEKVKSLNKDMSDETWNSIVREYWLNDGLNDSSEFKEAWKKDVEALGRKSYLEMKKYQSKLGYINPTRTSNIDITDGVDEKEMDLADTDRCEAFADLFSLALGAEGDRDIDAIKSVYKNCLEVVKKFIRQYLGIPV